MQGVIQCTRSLGHVRGECFRLSLSAASSEHLAPRWVVRLGTETIPGHIAVRPQPPEYV